jgi:hypothetical protein
METVGLVRQKKLFKKNDVVYDWRDAYLVQSYEGRVSSFSEEERLLICSSLSTGEIFERYESELSKVSDYYNYQSGNIVMYSENGIDDGLASTLCNVHLDRYFIRIQGKDEYETPRYIEDKHELHTTIMPFWLSCEVLPKLGFYKQEGGFWSDGYLNLYPEFPVNDPKKISRYKNVHLDRNYTIELVHDRTKFLGDESAPKIRTVHELQNVFTRHRGFPLQTMYLFF